MQSEPFPVERQILGSNPSLIRGGTTSYSFWNHHWDVKRQQERGARKKIANTEGAGYERLQLNFEINKEDRRVFLDVAPMKYLQPTIQMLSGGTATRQRISKPSFVSKEYNYNSNVTCGQTGFNVCFDYTEAANAIVASKVLFTDSDKVRFAGLLFSFSIPLIVFEEILEPNFPYLCPKISTFVKIVKMDMQFILELHVPNV
nr:hypothetical protein CFP56_61404 [Quercus suber]